MYSGLTDSIWRGAGLKEATPVSYTHLRAHEPPPLLTPPAVTPDRAPPSIRGSVNGDQEEVAVGAACARTVTIQFSGVQNGFSDGLLKVSVAAGGETLPVGTFQVIESVTRGGQTTVTAADAMLYLLDKDYVPTAGLSSAWAVLSDIADQSGVTLGASVTGFRSTLAAVDMSGLTTGHTGRTVVGWLAALCGRNAVISRAGKLEFVWYAASGFTLGQQDCYEGMDQVQESDRVFSVLAVTVTDAEGETTTLTPSGVSGSGGVIENDYMTQERLDAIWRDIGGLTYRPAELSFLGDLRLDAGDLISFTLADGTSCTVPAMNLTHTFDGGVTTQLTAAGQSETVSAAGGGVLTGKVKQLAADVAQLGALTVTDENGTTKINGGRIDTDSLFAQDITATGTISGLKLRGSDIDVETLYDEKYNSRAVIKTEYTDQVWGGTEYYYTLSLGVTYLENESNLTVDYDGIAVSAPKLKMTADLVSANLQSNETYTVFDSGLVSEGSVTVVKKLGWCLVHGSVTLTDTVSAMTNILGSAKVPAPQTGVGIYTTAGYWTSSYTRLMRVGVGAGGSLRIMYGDAGTFPFSIAYPIA